MARSAALIVLVDDDPDFLELQKRILEQRGYRTRCFSAADEALEAMRSEKPDLVLTDLMMSTLDAGFAFARRLKEEPRLADVPLIVITAIGPQRGLDLRPRSPADLAAMRADAWFDKPVAPEALLSAIEELLARRKAEGPP